MEAILALIALAGVGYAGFCGFKWIMKNGQIQSGSNAPLSPSDLRVLEESAERLMADMRIVTDECVARIEQACIEAQMKLDGLEPLRLSSASETSAQSDAWTPIPIEVLPVNHSMTGKTEPTKGELALMQGLRSMEQR